MFEFKSFSEMVRFFTNINSKDLPKMSGYICFTKDSFTKEYSEESRTYEVFSDAKAFTPGMGGYSIFGYAIDGSDPGVRLDSYMRDPKNPWKVEKCYIKPIASFPLCNAAGIAIYVLDGAAEKVLAGINDEKPEWYDIVSEQDEDGEIEPGFNMGKFWGFIPLSRCERIGGAV